MSSTRLASRFRQQLARATHTVFAQALYWVAVVWRRLLRRTTFIAVTGTHGKTTTKEILAAILATRWPTFRLAGNENTGLPLTRNVLRVRHRDRFAILEVGIGAPGEMRRLARLVRPDVAVVLALLRAHVRAFRDADAQASEKAILVRRLRRGGVAVLNADDARIGAMAAVVPGEVVRVGTSSAFDVWADGATARWPRRLEFDVHTATGESHHVVTRLVGTHWLTPCTVALATARRLGVPLAEAAAALALVEPVPGRLQPVALPSGAVMLRDDYDGSIEAFNAALGVLAEARAARRIAVITDASDYGNTPRRKRLAALGKEAARVAEVVVFVGEHAVHGQRGALAAGHAPEDTLAFEDLQLAGRFLRTVLRAGDLVLLKGDVNDHLGRLCFALLGSVRCWRTQCDKAMLCDDCDELGASAADRERTTISVGAANRLTGTGSQL